MSAQVQPCSFGFVVVDEDDTLMPRMQSGLMVVFHGRIWAKQYAAAIDSNDMDACHRLIADHGKVYRYAV